MRLLTGMGLGVGQLRIVAIVVDADEPRLTKPLSASVPVLTDQRSTPHCAKRWGAARRERKQRNRPRERCISILQTERVVERRVLRERSQPKQERYRA